MCSREEARPAQERGRQWTGWRKLLDLRDLPQEQRRGLIGQGWMWVSAPGHRLRKDWSFLWQLLRKHGLPLVLETEPVLALCREWLLHEGMETDEWDHLYEECLDGGVRDQEFLEAVVRAHPPSSSNCASPMAPTSCAAVRHGMGWDAPNQA